MHLLCRVMGLIKLSVGADDGRHVIQAEVNKR